MLMLFKGTETVNPYEFEDDDCRITLIDTPGFNDTEMNEGDILKCIADWLDNKYRNEKVKLDGIIYLQSIMEPRITGSALRNLKMFRELCGVDSLKNVLLVTCWWGVAAATKQKLELAEKHEVELRTGMLLLSCLSTFRLQHVSRPQILGQNDRSRC